MKKEKLLENLQTVVVICVFVLINYTSLAQFEQKVSINLSGVIVVPELTNASTMYIPGVGADGGLQFNINRHVSILANARFFFNYGNDDHPDTYYEDLAVGGGIKYNLAPKFVVNPYVFGEFNINFLWFEDFYEYDEPIWDGFYHEFGDYETDFATTIGVFGGGGVDFKLGENFAIYLQAGPYFTMYDNRLDVYGQLGLRINIFKSKTI